MLLWNSLGFVSYIPLMFINRNELLKFQRKNFHIDQTFSILTNDFQEL